MMRLVVDANELVAEAFRVRGQELIAHVALELLIAERAWGEAQHEIEQRLRAMVRHGRLTEATLTNFLAKTLALIDAHVAVVPPEAYAHWEGRARSRIPRDPDDWPTVAVALELDAGIWTNDGDFLGCGCPTWITQTLRSELG